MKQAERLKKLLSELGVNQASFARALGISKGQITNILNGEREISNILALAITAVYTERPINSNWLLTGEGEMFLGDGSTPLTNHAGNTNKPNVIIANEHGVYIGPPREKKSKTKSADVVSLEGLTDEQRKSIVSLVESMRPKKNK